MLVFQFKIILIRLFCLEHQHGRHGFCRVGPWGMSENALINTVQLPKMNMFCDQLSFVF